MKKRSSLLTLLLLALILACGFLGLDPKAAGNQDASALTGTSNNQDESGFSDFADSSGNQNSPDFSDAANNPQNSGGQDVNNPQNSGGQDAQKLPGMTLTMLDVGQGLSLLIEEDGRYMLYDGGGRSASSYIVSYLLSRGVKELDMVAVSHYDEDHMAGLIGVMKNFPVKTLLRPEYRISGKLYDSFQEAAEESGCTQIFPGLGDSYSLGNARIEVIGPTDYEDDMENNRSLSLKLSYGGNSFVCFGDTEARMEAKIIKSGVDISADLYVVSHHGSGSSSSKNFVKAIAPAYAFISVGEGNASGHPAEKTLKTLENAGCKVYRTDLSGEVSAVFKGSGIEIIENPVNEPVEAYPAEDAGEYILNISSKKFHGSALCKGVQSMSEKNKSIVTLPRQQLIDRGYSPCGICKP